MAKSPKMTAKRRKRLPKSSFGVPSKRKYPLDTKGRARNALARVAQHGSSSQKAQVRKAVRRRYPSIAVGGRKQGKH
ncbi:hypothetical protein [Streptomyces malaysiensis]|uniref:Uncharacterized protein n=1 Tax=Streptomyces malaysiensis subsp. samsunensis TaxID=459658 RepID=A0A9X2LY44_STRMQ|nr:hypothetical protein [Streptomyces samsunensis]MCQ8831772.1 hypothetical protein [Streptomyces samsunensis]